ncbi:MAG: amidohydrolase family protein [Myxococcales bacterium]|nr:amidohydrolase family protein [Myxococcales bacterium]
MIRTLLLLAALVAPTTALADTVIVNGLVHSVSQPPRRANILIQGERIVEISPGIQPSAGDQVIDATDMVITPGLVDFDTQVGMVEIWAVDATNDTDPGDDPIRSGFRAADALNANSTVVPITRNGGITSVVSHPSGGIFSGQSVWWDLVDGDPTGPAILTPAVQVLNAGNSGSSAAGGSRGTLMMRLRELFSDVQIYEADSGQYRLRERGSLSASVVDLEALVPVLNGEVPVFARAHRQADIIGLLNLADEYGFRLIIGGSTEAWAVAERLADEGVPVVLNPFDNAPSEFEQIGARADAAAVLAEAGVSIILTSNETHNVRTLRQLAGNAVRAGLDHEVALAAITLNPAAAVGLDSDYGTLEAGKIANIVVWSGDPFELSTQPRHILVHGQEVSMDSRQSALFERYRTLEDGVNRLPSHLLEPPSHDQEEGEQSVATGTEPEREQPSPGDNP